MEFMKSKLKVSFPLLLLLICLVPFIEKDPVSFGFGVFLLMNTAETESNTHSSWFFRYKDSKLRSLLVWSGNTLLIALIALRLADLVR